MQEHVHTGPVAFVFAGVSALVLFNLLRLAAVALADNPKWEWLAKGIGGLITFSADTSAA